MTLEWKEDPSPLHMLECGESVIVGDWQLRIDKLKDIKRDGVLGAFFNDLSDKERKVLDMRFGLDGKRNLEEERHRKRKREGEKTHPYMWKVEHVGDGFPSPFTHMGGRATSAEHAKTLAEVALKYAGLIYDAIRTESP